MNRYVLGLMVVAWAGCGGAGPNEIVSARKVPSASGAPQVARVVDLGDFGAIPDQGALPPADGDGVFVVGEQVLIEGSDFGKQPTVLIGGRPTSVEGRTGSGAIIARIPPEVPAGKAAVEVSHPGGRHAVDIDIRRYGFAVQPGADKVQVFIVDRRGAVEPAAAIDVAGARDVAMTGDGQIALVAAASKGKAGARVAVIAVTASGGPKLVRELRLAQAQVEQIACAYRGAVGAVAGGGQLTLLGLQDPRNPIMYEPMAVPAAQAPDAGQMARIAVSPGGGWIVLLMAGSNQLVPVDVSNPAASKLAAAVPLLPEARVPLVRDMAFSPRGDELWVVAGDNAEALKTGAHPTRLILVDAGEAGFSVKGAVEMSEAGAPTAMAVARRETISAGTAITSRDDRAPIAVATVDRSLFQDDLQKSLGGAFDMGQLVRANLAGEAETLATEPGLITALTMTHDARYLIAVATRPGQGGMLFGLLTLPLQGGTPVFTNLGAIAAEHAMQGASVTISP